MFKTSSPRLFLVLFISFFLTSLSAQCVQTSGPEGGCVHTMDNIDGTIWAGTSDGLYKSQDNGASWTRSNFLTPNDNIKYISHSGSEIFILVNKFKVSAFWSYISIYTTLLYRSTDGGANWEIHPFSSMHLTSYYNPKIIRAGDGNLYRIDYYDDDLIKSEDNGANWEVFNPPANLFGGVKTLFAKHFFITNSNTNKTYISNDFGESWTLLGTFSHILYNENDLIIASRNDSTFVSQDLGQNFTSSSQYLDPPPHYSIPIFRGESGNLIYKYKGNLLTSSDNGVTWLSTTTQAPYHWGIGDECLIETGGHFIYGNYYGFYQIEPNNYFYSNNGFIGSAIPKVYIAPNGNIYVQRATSSHLFKSENDGISWEKIILPYDAGNQEGIHDMIFKGDTAFIATTQHVLMLLNGEITKLTGDSGENYYMSLFLDGNTLYTPSKQKGVIFTNDVGANWQDLNLPTDLSNEDLDDFMIANGNYLLSVTGGRTFVSTNQGSTWTETASGGGSESLRFTRIGDRIFIDKGYKISDDFGLSWQQYEPEGLPSNSFGRTALPFREAGSDSLIFATIGRGYGLYISTDGGDSWAPMNDGLTATRSYSIAYDGNKLVLGTENNGVWIHDSDLTIKTGLVYNDENNNGAHDIGEKPLSGVLINTNQTFTKSKGNGQYSTYADNATDSIKAVAPISFSTVSPSGGYQISSNIDGYDFGIHFLANHPDLLITMTSLTPFRPGFDNKLYINIKNKGTEKLQPKVKLTLDSKASFLSASPDISAQNADTLIWQLGDLDVLESTDIIVNLNVTASAMIGDSIVFASIVSPVENDETPENNIAALQEIIVGSFDPNDKKVAPSTNYPPEYLTDGRSLTYTIRFQNTGNYQADNVKVIDTISPNLDLRTLEIVSYSHPVSWSIEKDNALTFLFNNINLPDSTSNEIQSHGFVQFRIKPKEGLALGTPIDNTAQIYFDFNQPIVTNTVETKFDHLVSIFQLKNANILSLSPNPASSHIKLNLHKTVNGKGQMDIFDMQGHLLFSKQTFLAGQELDANLPSLPTGDYLIKFSINEEQFIGQLIIAR
ncbi:MAG TPA: T9SS type A sorting domain-containing protein [Saprospiraceae bacterium]|nr:T9SS type A sorting domain-containing protein [Saprospiraceae bacterium]